MAETNAKVGTDGKTDNDYFAGGSCAERLAVRRLNAALEGGNRGRTRMRANLVVGLRYRSRARGWNQRVVPTCRGLACRQVREARFGAGGVDIGFGCLRLSECRAHLGRVAPTCRGLACRQVREARFGAARVDIRFGCPRLSECRAHSGQKRVDTSSLSSQPGQLSGVWRSMLSKPRCANRHAFSLGLEPREMTPHPARCGS